MHLNFAAALPRAQAIQAAESACVAHGLSILDAYFFSDLSLSLQARTSPRSPMEPPEFFESERLYLRPPSLDDAQSIFEGYAQDPDVSRYLDWRPHKDIEETRAFIRRCESLRAQGISFAYCLVLKDVRRVIGMAELGADGVLGYVLEKASWGRGLMVEAIRPLIAWGLGPGGMAEIHATCDVDNPRSALVMQKAGMRLRARLPRHSLHPNVGPELRDAWSYSIRKSEE